MTIDLQQFCSTDEDRPYLLKPFSMGKFSYATNGHIMVRIPRREDIPECSKVFAVDKPLEENEKAKFQGPNFNLPPLQPSEEGDCDECFGSGREHSCPDCECLCALCGGTGTEIPELKTSTMVNGAILSLRYLRMAASLPGFEIATTHKDKEPLQFCFDGGVGCIMPRTAEAETHIKIEDTAAIDGRRVRSPAELSNDLAGHQFTPSNTI